MCYKRRHEKAKKREKITDKCQLTARRMESSKCRSLSSNRRPCGTTLWKLQGNALSVPKFTVNENACGESRSHEAMHKPYKKNKSKKKKRTVKIK